MYQWLRKCSLIISDGKDGLELSELHVTFTVFHRTIQSPNMLSAKVYNLAYATMQKISKEYTQVLLKAGYSNEDGENFDTIFAGSVIFTRIGRENPTDTYLEITAADGEMGYAFAGMNKTIAAGHSPEDIRREISKSFEEYGIQDGYHAELPQIRYPRGRVLFGETRDIARTLAYGSGHTWSIKNGKYETVELTKALPDDVIVLTSQTGLIGLPQQTPSGVQARALLNPQLMPNRRVKLDNRSIQRMAFPAPATPPQVSDFNFIRDVAIGPDGEYKVLAVDHIGDTRGNTWYSDMWMIGKDAQLPVTDQYRNMLVGPFGPPQPTPVIPPKGDVTPGDRHQQPNPNSPATPGR